ncbi:Uncharacterised protein [Salmonella enterica subsp. enterica serovar Bovismorbificans]|nr:Uncharacterised protein [Salmonella enterica subsp. enterica serovar Bovismorbificans]CNT91921.1 Uncharacterised protein [Salmonella enterica subsp. enterica serovar Bovismorbificans]CNU15770.1 Uncharacterised protein [Salmonella enterica subsp. enterica serovar Bovismorbificans]CPR40571.1 Uncharacterised protein [Salmonella enterica subsp. enterica serovar Bovismorbificans]
MTEQRLFDGIPVQFAVQEGFNAFRKRRQYRFQIRHQHAEQVDAHRANGLQVSVAAFLFSHHPRRLLVNITVSDVGQRHNLTDSFAEFTAFPCFANHRSGVSKGFVQLRIGQFSRQHAVETLIDKTGVTGCQVDYFIDDIGIDALDKVFQVQVDVINA